MDAVLNPNGNRTSCTVLSAGFRDKDAWMLHSPLACTKNATRVLSIWSPKLTHGSGLRTLITQRLANWRLALQARLQQVCELLLNKICADMCELIGVP